MNTTIAHLVWAFGILTAAVLLVNIVGASGWLFLIIPLAIILAVFTKPEPPAAI